MNPMIDALVSEAEAHDGFPAISDQALREARAGTRELITVGEDPLVAVGIVGNGEVDVVVAPAARGRGVGGALWDDLLARASDLKAWVHGENPAATHLVASRGFTPVRTLLRLGLPGSALANVETSALPDGVDLTTFDPENEHHLASLIRVNARAFASHPEQGQLSLDDLRDTFAEPWWDPADVLLAWEGDTLLAFAWIKTTGTAPEVETELYVIGVDPGAAGRGLGTSLLNHTLARMAEHAPARVTLYVEGDNEPALALYRRAGFHIVQTSKQWHRRLDA